MAVESSTECSNAPCHPRPVSPAGDSGRVVSPVAAALTVVGLVGVIGFGAMLAVVDSPRPAVEGDTSRSAVAVRMAPAVANNGNASALERRGLVADWRGTAATAPRQPVVEPAPLWVHLEFDAPQWHPVPEAAAASEVTDEPAVASPPTPSAATESPTQSVHSSGSAAAPENQAVPTPDPAPAATSPTEGNGRLAQIHAIANTVPFNWKGHGVTFHDGCEPGRGRCPWGSWVAPTKDIWIGPGAFQSQARLHYVVAHELAHAWQYANDPAARMNDLEDWGKSGVDGLEAAADCIAKLWGATMSHYWDCPSDARAHMQGVLAAHR